MLQFGLNRIDTIGLGEFYRQLTGSTIGLTLISSTALSPCFSFVLRSGDLISKMTPSVCQLYINAYSRHRTYQEDVKVLSAARVPQKGERRSDR